MSGDDVPTAVRVVASTSVDFAFGLAESGGATRSAVGQETEDSACFEIGSFAAALNLGDSILGPLANALGLDTGLTLLNYQALADVDLSLGDIALSPTIGSTDALLDPSGVRVGDLLDATIYAMQHDEENGDAETSLALQALQLIRANPGLDLDGTVVIPDVVSIDAGDTASLSTALNVLEIVGASLALANGENFLGSQIPVNLGALGTGSINVTAVQGPRYTCGHPWATPSDDCQVIRDGGGACARQSQVSVGLSLDTQPIKLAEVGANSITLSLGPVSLTGGVGNAKGVLTSVDECGPPDKYTVNVGAGLLGVSLNVPISVSGSVSVALPNVAGITNILGNVLSGQLLSGLLGNTQYEFRNYKLTVAIDGATANLHASSPGTTSTDDAHLESPTNDRSGQPVRVPDPAQAPALGSLTVPSNLITGNVSIRLEYEWRRRTVGLSLVGLPIPPYGAWGPGPASANGWIANTTQAPPGNTTNPVLVGANLSDLSSLPAPLNTLGATISSTLTSVTNLANTQLVHAVNTTLNSTLLPLLGLSGTGADLYSVSRPLCGGPPKLVG